MSEPAGPPRPALGAVSWAAPGRLNLIGEHTDYNDGFVLPVALPFRTTATVRPGRDGWLRLRSAQRPDQPAEDALGGWLRLRSAQRPDQPAEYALAELAPGQVKGWAAYVAGVLWAFREAGHDIPAGLEVVVDGVVPEGAGLSSSAALECAVAAAVNDLGGTGLSPVAVAQLTQRAENEFVGVPNGLMDQLAAMLCVEANALFLDTRNLHTEQVPLDLAGPGLALLVADTRAPHQLSNGGEYAQRRHSCERACRELGVAALRDVSIDTLDAALARLRSPEDRRRVRHVVTENDRVLRTVALLRAGRPAEVGPLLTASHVSLRDDYGVTVDQLDVAVDAGLAAGALGARMTGAGFGGSVLLLVEAGADGQRAVRESIQAAFARRGYLPPTFFVAVPSAGAHRLADEQ